MIMKKIHLINKIIPLLFLMMISSCNRSEELPIADYFLSGSWDVVNSEYPKENYVFGLNGNEQQGLHYYSDYKQIRESSYFSYMLSSSLLTIRFTSQDNVIDEFVYRIIPVTLEEIYLKSTIPGFADVHLKKSMLYYD